MLKSVYDSFDAIPEGDRQHYHQQDGKYVLQLDEQHPVLVKNKELLREKSTDKAAITRLTNEKATLEATALPAGHVAVPAADAQLINAYKPLGKPEEITAMRTERDDLKTKVAKSQRLETLRSVAEVEGYDVEVLSELVTDEQSFEIKEVKKDGKEIKQANIIVETDGKKESKPLAEFAQEKWAKFMPALKPADAKPQGTPYVPQKKGAPPKPEDPVAAYLGKAYAEPKK